MARVIASLDVGEAIVVLDNCEHVLDAVAELVDRLLAALPDLRIVATSREALALTGESLLYLGPLGVPGDAVDVLDPAALAAVPSVRLFVDRAVAVRSEFALDATTAGAVAEICRRLDGLPLALELAAATLRSMNIQQLAHRLDDRFRVLEAGSRTALPHQRTLLALVEWSWELLSEPERILARRLAVFPGGATLAALEAVCADARLPAAKIFGTVRALVEKSMVQLSDDSDPRYRMLETIRAYAIEQFDRSGDDIADAFVAYHLELAATHEPVLRSRGQLEAIARFDAEHDNLLAALRTALDGADAERAADFVAVMFWYWGIRGMSTHFDSHLERLRQREPELPERTAAAFALIRLFAGTPVHRDLPVLDLIAKAEAAGALSSSIPRCCCSRRGWRTRRATRPSVTGCWRGLRPRRIHGCARMPIRPAQNFIRTGVRSRPAMFVATWATGSPLPSHARRRWRNSHRSVTAGAWAWPCSPSARSIPCADAAPRPSPPSNAVWR